MRNRRKKGASKELSSNEKILSVATLIFFIAILGWFTYLNLKEASHHNRLSKLSVGMEVSNDLVCMVNDTYMGEKQLLVPVDEKDYYGCCEMCVEKLQNNIDNVRYAIDPLTQELVDKATAFIILKSDNSKAVLYFQSGKNYSLYKNRKSN